MSEPTQLKQSATIRNWGIIGATLYGDVVGHPRLGDQKMIHTSHIVYVDLDDVGVVETLNTVYKLEGDPVDPVDRDSIVLASQELQDRHRALG